MSAVVNRACLATAVVFLVAMVALVLVQVLARYGFARPPDWTEEAARYAMVWSGLLGATVAFHERADPVLLSAKHGLLRSCVRLAGVLLFTGPILFHATQFIRLHLQRTAGTLEINSALVVAVVPLSAAVICLHAIAQFLQSAARTSSEP